jgi:hypothetical protein
LTGIQHEAPRYRDVERLLAQVQAMNEAKELLATAETAYQAQQWPAAVQAYEALRHTQLTSSLHISPRPI